MVRCSDHATQIRTLQCASNQSYQRLSDGTHPRTSLNCIVRHLILHINIDAGSLTSYRAVVDATNQIGNQEALEFARVVDPEGHRTVGVLTKCDVVQKGDESRVSPSY